MTEQQALKKLNAKGGKFFTVAFKRKTAGRNGEPVGSLRVMTCRRHVKAYVSGKEGAEHRQMTDRANGVLTVWDVEVFRKLRAEGKALREAGKAAYRRVNLAEVVSISRVEK